ncbi:Hypothetical predicted protein [Mytilus galloprovincialis]|uniref:DZIP3-like HEPN domain-containing protein n=1 Tax=Mytilus galloprovincialis TaxID=29158 RepID=A0A8B6FA31_MYTGA|nr:Hypothetical predicted protein [Mytilus galloprovincialis]
MITFQMWKIKYGWILFVFQFSMMSIKTFKLKCPSNASWKLRAQVKCNNTLKYFCLYNNVADKYVEGCKGPDWDRKGSKRIYAGDFSRGKCTKKRFQPFIFWTNGSITDCVYAKSVCSAEGQVVYMDNSTKDDRACRCDYENNYSFIKTPRNVCYCIPSEEDCSCSIKSCPENYTLSADYKCTTSDFHEVTQCKNINRYNITLDENTEDLNRNINLSNSQSTFLVNWSDRAAAAVFCLFIMCIVVAGLVFSFVDLLNMWIRKQLQQFRRSTERYNTDTVGATISANKIPNANTIEINTHESYEKMPFDKKKEQQITTDEVNFLRIVHLLFSVACPVVRMAFNHEIHPNQLRKTLNKNKILLEKLYRRKGKLINDFQWNLLFKGETVSSDDFDITLMVNLLRTLANISIVDIYPAPSDASISAMLTRISYISNKVIKNVEGQLSEDQFNQYWDDIGQAVLKLVSSFELDIDNDQQKIRLIGRLLALNPISLDIKKLCMFIDMSEKYPAMILQKLISEYNSSKNVTTEDVLRKEKHQLYHKRKKHKPCCICTTEYVFSVNVIQEEQWEKLYEINESSDLHVCTSNLRNCCERYIPKRINTSDITVATTLVLNVPDILSYMIDRLCVNGIDKFMMHNKHTLYHYMEKKRCCMCHNEFMVPTEKICFNKGEWNRLYVKENNTVCSVGSTDCCCKYSVRNAIQYTDMDDISWAKIFHVVGPISIISKIRNNTLSYFLNWNADDKILRQMLTELLQIIQDEKFCNDMLRRIASSNRVKSRETIATKIDTSEWVSKHFRHNKETTEQQLQMIVLDKVGLNVKSLKIPIDCPLPHITKKFIDLTPEEIHFLVSVHALSKIVYPVIRKEFDRLCQDQELEKIRNDMYEQQNAQYCNGSDKDGTKSINKRIHLTQIQQQQLFSPKQIESKNLDLELMIYILKRRIEEEDREKNVGQLEVIANIRREIVQSSSGYLVETRYQDIIKSIRVAVMHFEGEFDEEKVINIHQIQNINFLK